MSKTENSSSHEHSLKQNFYQDIVYPAASSTGKLIGMIPRAINAALSKAEKWILEREYNIAETKKILEKKLEGIPPEDIKTPEAYVAIPAIEYISYCVDSAVLRDMYANLLANSMTDYTKKGTHPAFVEIIKQLSPDEARIIDFMFKQQQVLPTLTIRYEYSNGSGVTIANNVSNVGELADCENIYPLNTAVAFDNLIRLGLLVDYSEQKWLTDESTYTPLKNLECMATLATDDAAQKKGFSQVSIDESYVELTNFGHSFCVACLSSPSSTREE